MTISQPLRFWGKVIFSMIIGLTVTYNDSRPNWDDAGISAAMVFGSAFIISMIDRSKPWLWALLIGVWIPFFGIILNNNWPSLLALAITFAGAYSGNLISRQIK